MPERDAADLLRDAKRVVVFTGAGMSAESGVPTFRDSLTGLWARFDPQALATPEAFEADPALVWGWYEWRRAEVERVAPNAGHRAVVAIANRVASTVVITQNIDDLHERAGSEEVVHLHGSLFEPRCSGCGRPAETGDRPAEGGPVPPPVCGDCGADVRPGVVWFGEQLPVNALSAAAEAAFDCDLLLTIGTSGMVYPAAEIPYVADRAGAKVIQINPEATALDSVAAVSLRGPAAQVLPDLVAKAWGGR
ncbi:SIR2 family NAD-dependent protein deacylase [Paractinoplanes toevensis]|uniref:NAD-dependent protein deacylase n=1 Tax=Paractinoplanes toevensis TaxID=571911 RepID=A0A919TED8_9ACTN|nr:NAD-dependent deacylase [Actinoplanes toevensis]GIM93301.1 NAD-dependent protein deacylase 1 [Actinoplanes toevensis]